MACAGLLGRGVSCNTLRRVQGEQRLHAGRAVREVAMKTLHERCAGLDVHQETAMCCLRVVSAGKVHRGVRQFPTTTRGLLEQADWLDSDKCTHVAMEATGVY
jgi:hypothetical protein